MDRFGSTRLCVSPLFSTPVEGMLEMQGNKEESWYLGDSIYNGELEFYLFIQSKAHHLKPHSLKLWKHSTNMSWELYWLLPTHRKHTQWSFHALVSRTYSGWLQNKVSVRHYRKEGETDGLCLSAAGRGSGMRSKLIGKTAIYRPFWLAKSRVSFMSCWGSWMNGAPRYAA